MVQAIQEEVEVLIAREVEEVEQQAVVEAAPHWPPLSLIPLCLLWFYLGLLLWYRLVCFRSLLDVLNLHKLVIIVWLSELTLVT